MQRKSGFGCGKNPIMKPDIAGVLRKLYLPLFDSKFLADPARGVGSENENKHTATNFEAQRTK